MAKATLILRLILLVVSLNNYVYSQIPNIQWQKCFGGSSPDQAYSIEQTFDGGYITVGSSYSIDGDITGHHGTNNNDYWVVKINITGNIEWQKSLGGSSNDQPSFIQQTTDSGYIISGTSSSIDGDVTLNHGNIDVWIVKLNKNGIIQWQKSLGGSQTDVAYSITQTQDGGYIFAGYTTSIDFDITSNHGGGGDCWLVKLSSTGTIQWQKTYGGSKFDCAISVIQTKDGGFITAGYSNSNDGDISGNHGSNDYWILKLSSQGNIEWQKAFGGSGSDIASSIKQTSDDSYIISGGSASNNGNVSGHHGDTLHTDTWIIKLSSSGNLLWQKSFGGLNYDGANGIQITSDKGYIFTGATSSNDGDVSGNHGSSDYWIVKIDSIGNLLWQKTVGGSYSEDARNILQTKDGGYIIVGTTLSNDGDVSNNHGGSLAYDYWIVKLNSGIVTPLDITDFYSYKRIKEIKLIWKSSNEYNVEKFHLQKGTSPNNFKTISTIQAIGKGNNDYSIIDSSISFTSKIYYRLMIVDKNGKSYLSKVICESSNEVNESIFLNPNPAKDFTSIRFTKPFENVSIIVYDISGKIVINQSISWKYLHILNTVNLKNGVYFIKINTDSGSYSKKLLINK